MKKLRDARNREKRREKEKEKERERPKKEKEGVRIQFLPRAIPRRPRKVSRRFAYNGFSLNFRGSRRRRAKTLGKYEGASPPPAREAGEKSQPKDSLIPEIRRGNFVARDYA